MVKVNGEMLDCAGKNIAEVLAAADCAEKRVAVELNEDIVPRAKYCETIVNDGDTVVIVRYEGGG